MQETAERKADLNRQLKLARPKHESLFKRFVDDLIRSTHRKSIEKIINILSKTRRAHTPEMIGFAENEFKEHLAEAKYRPAQIKLLKERFKKAIQHARIVSIIHYAELLNNEESYQAHQNASIEAALIEHLRKVRESSPKGLNLANAVNETRQRLRLMPGGAGLTLISQCAMPSRGKMKLFNVKGRQVLALL